MIKVKLIENVSNASYDALDNEVEWLNVTHLGGNIPRLIALQCAITDNGYPLYRYPIDKHIDVKQFSPTVMVIKQKIENLLGETYNHCIIQKYRDGNDFISRHADKTLDIMPNSSIVNYSIGSERIMKFRSKIPFNVHNKPPGSTIIPRYEMQDFILKSDSILSISLETNRYYTHEIKKNHLITEPRISITFRNIGTFYNPITGVVSGIGKAKDNTSKEELLRSFGRENNTHATYNELYAKGFGTIFD